MKCGISVHEFWELTPIETIQTIEAFVWNEQRNEKIILKLAYDIAALSRQKRLPSFNSLMARKPAKKLVGAELRERREEFKKMTSNLDLSIFNKVRLKKK